MKSLILSLLTSLSITLTLSAQVVTTVPEFPSGDEEITITFDATQASDSRASGLLGLTSGVYLWSGAGSTENGDAFEFEPPGQTNFNAAYEPGAMTSPGNDKWEIKITPRTYYQVPDGTPIVKLGLVFKNTTGSAQTEDIVIELIQEDEFQISLSQPNLPAFFNENETFNIEVSSSEASTLRLFIDNVEVASTANATSLSETITAAGPGGRQVKITGLSDADMKTDEINFSYLVRQLTIEEVKPVDVLSGINYPNGDDTKATLCLLAPGKSSVYVVGDFNEWMPQANYQMKRDGDFFWLEISQLTPGTEYAFQYLVDETIYIADPYSDKILNPPDKLINSSIYPDLKAFPAQAQNEVRFYNTVSVIQTAQTPYQWTVENFQKPEPSELVIYELLVRDFFGNGEESFTNLIDTLSYIKSLGVNAIELMPITEFNGNDSWGYNPTFMFAPDKAYGTKNELKAFIDAAHELGIAVILDVVLNQQEQPSPLVLLDFNTATSQVTADNPYFNIEATHPFNVFYDMNHESTYTQSFVDTVNHYWINEYRFDGFRFDLSKGFTQTNYGNDVGAWSNYDAGRVALLKRMADKIWSHTPDAYVILEHFANNTEEKELAEYGMMLWGNMHGPFKQSMLGFSTDSDISGTYYANRDWTEPHLVSYMESHDEERLMYDTRQFGNFNDNYSTKTESNALRRMRAAFAVLLTIPGPKMYWQFGELGYEVSIDENGRTGQKPAPWDNSEGENLYDPNNRQQLRSYVSEITKLRNSYNLFSFGDASISSSNSLIKQFSITTNESTANPSSAGAMSAVVVANFGLEESAITVQFPFDGTWYSYFDENTVTAASGTGTLNLRAGNFAILTNYELSAPDLILSSENIESKAIAYPNPTKDFVEIQTKEEPLYYFIYDLKGQDVRQGKFQNSNQLDLRSYDTGVLIIEIITRKGNRIIEKVIKNQT